MMLVHEEAEAAEDPAREPRHDGKRSSLQNETEQGRRVSDDGTGPVAEVGAGRRRA